VATYWYPGERRGWEFIYPREQATSLAKSANRSILTTAVNVSTQDEMRTAELARVTPSGQQAPLAGGAEVDSAAGSRQRGELVAEAPAASGSANENAETARTAANPNTNSDPAITRGVDAPRVQGSTQSARTRISLPATASTQPLIVLIGLLSLACATAIGLYRRVRV
jgi:hypothetical protein